METILVIGLVFAAPPGRDADRAERPRELKVEARAACAWRTEKPVRGVARSAREVGALTEAPAHVAGDKGYYDAIAADAAHALKVKEIDWSKHMLVVVTAGRREDYLQDRIEILGARVQGGTLTVTWRLHSPAASGGRRFVSYPSQMLLVERFDGRVRFEERRTAEDN